MKNTKGVRLWNTAKEIIPGGTQLLSKRAEQFLPGQWPSYYQTAKGIALTDLDGNNLRDFSIMGVGSCILGYADPNVNRAVQKAICGGNMSTLNCPEEVELAQVLLKMHPWAGMVRYARTGGESMAVAVRIARAHSGRDKIAFCGYHGWHDWYLAANLGARDSLDGHLLPGLEPRGVPRSLRRTSFPFRYNHIEELQRIVSQHDIGAIVMEPMRSVYPEKNFLKRVRSIATRAGAVLVFDEITAGFRLNVGGIHQTLGVVPDIAVYAKGISNGYPMGAIVGRKKIMRAAEESFISSTYWTERIGPAAALAALAKMRNRNVPAHLATIGKMITEGWKERAAQHGLSIATTGIPALTTFAFQHGPDSPVLHTLFTQEMLERGFLAGKSVYVSYAHGKKDVADYLAAVDEVFARLKTLLDKDRLRQALKGPVAGAGFKRLT